MKQKKRKERHCEEGGLSIEIIDYVLSHPTYDVEGNKIIYVNGVEVGRVYTNKESKD